MALTAATTIASAMAVTDQVVTVTSATGISAGMLIRIDDEYMVVDRSYASGVAVPVVQRGTQASRVVAHNALAPFVAGLFSDFAAQSSANDTQWPPKALRDQASYSVSGAIAIPNKDTFIVINKAGVAAMTLAAPAVDQDGLKLVITSTTAQAHTITATSLIADGTSGSPHTTVTFTTGYKGQGITLIACQGLWQVQANVNTTIS